MKKRLLITLVAALTAGGIACDSPQEERQETIMENIEDSREAFASSRGRELEALEENMEELKDRIEASGEEPAATVRTEIEAWERDYAAVEARLDADVTTVQALRDLEQEVDASISALRSDFAEMSSRLAARLQ